MKMWTIENKLSDGSIVYNVALETDHESITFRAVSDRDATLLMEALLTAIDAHTVEEIKLI